MVDFGNKIRILRKGKKLTQTQLAERVHVTKSVISAYESGSRYPSYPVLIKLAAIFGVATDYLLGVERGETIDVTGLAPSEVEAVMQMVNVLKDKKDTKSNLP